MTDFVATSNKKKQKAGDRPVLAVKGKVAVSDTPERFDTMQC